MSVRSRRSAVLAGALLALVLPAVPAVAAQAAPHAAAAAAPKPATLTVTGEGRATAEPDMAIVTAGVEANGPTAKDALAAQSRAADALLAAVREAGVADRDIRTESLATSAVYETGPEPGAATRVAGYRATQSFTVKVRDLDRTGALIQAIADATGDDVRIDSVVFDIADPGRLRSAARAAAYADAHEKAVQYAKASGHKLGRLVSLEETTSGRPRPVAVPAMAFDQAAGKVPVAAGEIEDAVSVTAVYELN
ncbi:SIMPL domain-containing protein [Streptomyces kunmingensis]|uniref:SIMPL domain-containing protein n=1 Tax=Streptomyces kunmingensis TaxID=68225 RepID=A0ABU6CLI0_9ACTN|nr:SIMPL domain-containing protein [Streptomyces kunmingensis]MEB3964760.1 SIMPL domain-containing protein [Streptomyces kunmingensis]